MLKKYFGVFALAAVVLSACKKEADTPPLNSLSSILTIDSLRNMYQGTPIKFTQDYSVYGTITADETDGNLYKNLFIQDGDAALNMRLLSSSFILIGDRVRINLKGTTLSEYNGMLQLDSIDVAKNIVKQASGENVTPLDVTLTEISTALEGRLVRVNDVEFKTDELALTYSDAINQTTQNRNLTDCAGNTVLVRTSGFASYGGQQLAQGHGSLVAVVSEFNGTIQLYIRKKSEINMTGPRCTGNPPYIIKTLEDNSATSGGWSIVNVSGAINWVTNGAGSGHSGDYYVQCSNYVGGANQACETWYISPAINLTAGVNPVLTFINACNYSGSNIEVKVSSAYTSGDPNTVAWTTLSPALSGGSWSWVNSGNLSLSSFNGQSNVRVAFKYTGTSSNGKTWEIDDIKVAEL